MIVLSIGLSIAQIVLTEIKASGDVTSSQQAYLAAETGMEEVALLLKSGGSIPVTEMPAPGGGKYFASYGSAMIANGKRTKKLIVKGQVAGVVRQIEKDTEEDLNIVITGTVTIKDLYELSDLSLPDPTTGLSRGVTTCNQLNRGLGFGVDAYKPNDTGYPIAKNITIKTGGNLTTIDPKFSGAFVASIPG
ncbi:hypothetical protein AUK11_04315 [bacterium CG2_30_37_16]|nr:MAG: hypothetical protein AUK11_04315 [bacterium CG2_30_37_16]PIP30628.1 MAG: hypothetical protein COX25_03770 [bacterium (Candidatus Howlettbacteria) CG23_combo_of_CG06-09_8_20_14_all_37_9]PJB06257.1 MAG: hypothetical protein CO123_02505 [bacterium (Candidatus Howlettbacteria) CG_4_9_14_3_um_filter_37_10]